ncbi:MAG: hypothetical protein AB202_01255 [Parcubacteria bacterium C7867-007]|nr:MAG: hypothetical protein AB202_01255 [Parcubacteria bacterium C7867-007]
MQYLKSLAFRRFLKYALVGGSTLTFDLTLLYIATDIFGVPYYISTPIAFLIAVSINYLISRRFVFKGTERRIHHGYVYFITIAVVGSFATTALVTALVTLTGMYYLLARILVAFVIGIGNYLFNLYLNFRVVGRHQ